jgi:hypothetical protein
MPDSAATPLVQVDDHSQTENDVPRTSSGGFMAASYGDIIKYFTLMGWTAFGGPQAHIGMFETVRSRPTPCAVESRNSRTVSEFLQLVIEWGPRSYSALRHHCVGLTALHSGTWCRIRAPRALRLSLLPHELVYYLTSHWIVAMLMHQRCVRATDVHPEAQLDE